MQSQSAEVYRKCIKPVVLYGINMTGDFLEPEIFQMAAVHKNYGFNSYILPKKMISLEIYKKTGFKISNHKLYWQKRIMETINLKCALEKFIAFLKMIGQPVVLTAYTARKTESLILCKAMQEYGLWRRFSQVVHGFSELCPVVKKKLPGRRNYWLVDLTKDVLGQNLSKTIYNAIHDVSALEKIKRSLDISDEELTRRCLLLSQVEADTLALSSTKINRISLAFLKGFVSVEMIDRLAKAGINYVKLKQAYEMDNRQGVEILLNAGWSGSQQKIMDNRDEIVEKISRSMKFLTKKKFNDHGYKREIDV